MATTSWYLAQIRPNQIDRARINLERQGYGCFLPRRPVTLRRAGRMQPGLGPLFPGYLFLRIAADREWRPVNATYGVVRLVMRTAHVPQPVPEPLMADLFARTDETGLVIPPVDLKPGDVVRITAGPMADIVARVDGLADAERVGVLLEMMGQAVRAELPRAHLQRLAG